MKNKHFKVGDHILVYGNKGIVKEIYNCKEYKVEYKTTYVDTTCYSDENIKHMIAKGYTVTPTGRTATYFKVKFLSETGLENTAYDNGEYGCLDEYESYGTWN